MADIDFVKGHAKRLEVLNDYASVVSERIEAAPKSIRYILTDAFLQIWARGYVEAAEPLKARLAGARELLKYPRPEAYQFACWIEDQLRKHDDERGSDGWKDESSWWLIGRLKQEVDELADIGTDEYDAAMVPEAADVGAFAMFIADITANDKPQLTKLLNWLAEEE